jgi:uncharacterized membrane protein YjfL (UPF0719 family)
MFFAPALCLAVLLAANLVVFEDTIVVAMVTLYEFCILRIVVGLFICFGISPLADGVSRDNLAARIATVGGMLGSTLMCVSAPTHVARSELTGMNHLLGLFLFLLGWGILEAFTSLSERITIDRDESSALRLCGILLGWGLVCGSLIDDILQVNFNTLWATLAALAIMLVFIITEIWLFARRVLWRHIHKLTYFAAAIYIMIGVIVIFVAR